MDLIITEITAHDVLRNVRTELGLPEAAVGPLDEACLAGIIRRAAGILCPCSVPTLRFAVLESLQHLDQGNAGTAEQIDALIDKLTVGGDLLELSQIAVEDPTGKGTWIFTAPPSFVVRRSGSVFLIGLSPDENSPLPDTLRARISCEGCTRVIEPQPGEELPGLLRDLGLQELSERNWLKAPKESTSRGFIDAMTQRLNGMSPSGAAEDVTIIDPSRKTDFYPKRWTSPNSRTGDFVARRPQMYGAPIWGFARFDNGSLTKFLDFPLKGTRWRGCDQAWQLQMALDACQGTPQRYAVQPDRDGAYLDFFSPIPLWAERRFALLGRQVARRNSLFTYWLSMRELPSEEEFLQNHLWLSRLDRAP